MGIADIAGAEITAYREANRAALPAAREAQQDEMALVDTSLRDIDLRVAALKGEEAQIRALETLRATDRRRLEDIAAELSVAAAQRAPLAERRASLDTTMGDASEVEPRTCAYDRQLGQLQEQYSVVSTKLAEAETAQRLAERQQTERFSLLERAITPEYPLGSGGKKIAIAGAVGSALMALAVASSLIWCGLSSAQQRRCSGNWRLTPIITIPEVPKRKAPSGAGRKVISSLIDNEVGRVPTGGLIGTAGIVHGRRCHPCGGDGRDGVIGSSAQE